MTTSFSSDAFVQAVAGELAAAMGAPLGASLALTPSTPPPDASNGWLAAVDLTGTGRLTVWIDQAGASSLAAATLGEAADDAAIVDLLREISAQTVAAVALQPDFKGLTGEAAVVTSVAAPLGPSWFEADVASGTPVFVGISIERVAVAAPSPAAQAARSGSAAPSEMNGERLQALLSVELPLVARFGSVVLPMKKLAGLAPGAIVDIHRSPDDPVELLVGERVIALGEVVIVSGNYGVRITQIMHDLARSSAGLEAR